MSNRLDKTDNYLLGCDENEFRKEFHQLQNKCNLLEREQQEANATIAALRTEIDINYNHYDYLNKQYADLSASFQALFEENFKLKYQWNK